MNHNSIKNIKSQDALLINFQQLLIGQQMEIDFVPDVLVNIPQSTNQLETDEQFQNINLEVYSQKIEKMNKQMVELQKAVNYLYNENKAVKEINFNLTQQIFTNLYNQDSHLEQRTLYLNYEFTKQVNLKLRDDNEKLQDKILLMQIEHDQQKVKIQKLESKKTQDKQQLKDIIFLDNNILNDSQLEEVKQKEISQQNSQLAENGKQKDQSQQQTANTSMTSSIQQKVGVKSTKTTVKPTARKTMADINQSQIEEAKKNIQQMATPVVKKVVKKADSSSTFVKQEIKKK